jgi:hypothetical protein
LHGVVGRDGTLSLRRNGKAVTSLKAGRYTVSVDDQSTRRDFRIRTPHGKVHAITSAGRSAGRRRCSSSSPDDPEKPLDLTIARGRCLP